MRQILWSGTVLALAISALCGFSVRAADDATQAERRAQYVKQRMDRIKEALGSTEDEWKALEPKIEAVQKLQMAGFGGRRGGPGGAAAAPADEATKTDLQKKTDALSKLLENKDADAKTVQEALKALRDEREKSKEALKKAQADLKELLTAKQEAQLVLQRVLE